MESSAKARSGHELLKILGAGFGVAIYDPRVGGGDVQAGGRVTQTKCRYEVTIESKAPNDLQE